MTLPLPDLDAQLLAAHEAGDHAALVALYRSAADIADTEDARCFFLTQAYVFALEQDHPDCPQIHAELRALGRV